MFENVGGILPGGGGGGGQFGTAYKDSIIDTVMLLTKENIYKNRQKGKVTNIAEIKYELSVKFQYEQLYAGIEGKLPIFEQKWSDLIHI